MVELRKITYDNIYDILKLSVSEKQKDFVATNTDSIIQAYVAITNNGFAFPFGIYEGQVPVGFIMFGYSPKDSIEIPELIRGNYCLWRFMIDERYQGKGLGKEALRLGIEYLKSFPCGGASLCWLCYEEENMVAAKLYRSFGWTDSGEKLQNEVIAVRKL